MWVGLIQSVEGLNRTKRLSKRELLLPDCFKLGHQLPLAFGFELKHQLFLGLDIAGLQTATTPPALWVSDLWTQAGIKASSLLGLLLADSPCRSWDLLAFTPM